MSSDFKDYSGPTICECSVEDDDYHPSMSNWALSVEDFTPATFHHTHFYSNSNWSINEVDNYMDEMSLESLHVSYGVPNSISLEKAKDNKWPSCPIPEVVTAHLDFFTCGVRFHFHFFLDTCLISCFQYAPSRLNSSI